MTNRGGGILMLTALLLAACGQPIERAEAEPDLLFVQSGGGVGVVHSETGASRELRQEAIPSRTWSTLVRAVPTARGTRVEAIDPLDESILWKSSVPGAVRVRLVAEDGRRAVVEPTGQNHFTRGRGRTVLMVVGEDLERQVVRLEGNVEPEAFSTDGRSVFVLRYTPARRPVSYQVLKLDLTTEEVGEVYTPDAELQESMQGTARIQAVSPDGRYLYTLYTLAGDEGHSHAFIHVLNLDEEWAHCIDLPEGFGYSRDAKVAMAVTPDGERIYVADTGIGTAAAVDTRALSVTSTSSISTQSGGILHALSGPNGELILAKGGEVVVLEPDSLSVRYRTTVGWGVRGMQVSTDGTKLYVGLDDSVTVIDLATGEVLGALNPVGLEQIESFGPVLPTPGEEEPEEFTCAC